MTTITAPQNKALTFTTAEEALHHFNMGWIAEQHPLLTQSGIVVDSHKAIVRNDNQKVIGIVGKDYLPIQNNDAFGMFDVLIKKHNAKWTNVQSINGGSQIYLQISMGTGEVRKGDIVENRLTIFNAFNGSSSFKIFSTPYRLVCSNGMKSAVKSAEVRTHIRHTKNAMYRYEEALKIFGIAQKEFMSFIETSRRLAEVMIDKDKVVKLIRDTFEIPAESKVEDISTNKRFKMNQVYQLFKGGKGNSGASLYDFINGVTEYVDHHAGKDEIFGMVGAGATLKENAMALAVAELK